MKCWLSVKDFVNENSLEPLAFHSVERVGVCGT